MNKAKATPPDDDQTDLPVSNKRIAWILFCSVGILLMVAEQKALGCLCLGIASGLYLGELFE